MRRAQPEFVLTCQVARYLHSALPTGVPWSHFPAGEHRTEKTGRRLKDMGLQKGWPDFLLLWGGLGIAIELKAEKGRLGNEQVEFQRMWILQAGQHFVCRSVDGVDAALRLVGVPLKARLT